MSIPLPPRRNSRYGSSKRSSGEVVKIEEKGTGRSSGEVVQIEEKGTKRTPPPMKAVPSVRGVPPQQEIVVPPKPSVPPQKETAVKATRENKRTREPVVKKARGDKGVVKLNQRDLTMLTFAAKYRMITVDLMTRLTQSPRGSIKNRLNHLTNVGLLGRIYTQTATVYHSVAKTGAALGVEVSTGAPAYSRIDHDILLTGIAVEQALETEWAEQHTGIYPIILSERQMRSSHLTMTNSQRDGSFLDEPIDLHNPHLTAYKACSRSSKGSSVIPDMAFIDASGEEPRYVVVELELSAKKIDEYQSLLSAYQDNPLVKEVIYLTTKQGIIGRLERAVDFSGSTKLTTKIIDLDDIGGRVV